MDVSEILKQQQAALDVLRQNLASPSEAGLLPLLGDREQQATAVQARIDELSRQKDAAMSRYDAAIREQKNVLATLQNVTLNARQVLQGSASPTAPKADSKP